MKEMDSEESNSDPDDEEEESKELEGVAGLNLATPLVSKSSSAPRNLSLTLFVPRMKRLHPPSTSWPKA